MHRYGLRPSPLEGNAPERANTIVTKLTSKQTLRQIRRLSVLIVLTAAISSCAVLTHTTANVKFPAPDLTLLVANLTSSDPANQEMSLAPALHTDSAQPKKVILPPGSTLAVIPATWEVISVDQTGQPHLGRIQAALTRPGRPPTAVRLHLININAQWLLYETSPA